MGLNRGFMITLGFFGIELDVVYYSFAGLDSTPASC